VIVVIKVDQLAQFEVSGQRGGLGGHALHQNSVAHNRIGIVIDDFVTWTVKPCCQKTFGHRHADPVWEALSQRAGGTFNPWSFTKFGMSRRFTSPLPEALDFFDGQIISRQMEERIKKC
jgi:hypothetical protein